MGEKEIENLLKIAITLRMRDLDKMDSREIIDKEMLFYKLKYGKNWIKRYMADAYKISKIKYEKDKFR